MMKRALKAAFRAAPVRSALCACLRGYIRFVYATSRWRVEGAENIEPLLADGRPFIFAFWHGRILMTAKAWPYERASIRMVISSHRDGDLIAKTVAPFGVDVIRGSASRPGKRTGRAKPKGGRAALRAMASELQAGGCVGVTPDGPGGPAERVGEGTAVLAKLTGAPVVPFAYSTSRGVSLKTWDRFLAAAPFSRGAFVWGEPITIDRSRGSDAMERARAAIETALKETTATADRLVGRSSAGAHRVPPPAASEASRPTP